MGALDEGHYSVAMNDGCIDIGSDGEGEEQMAAIENAVRVLLKGLGEDVNREGLRKTPLRVAKAFREGTRGASSPPLFLLCNSNCLLLPCALLIHSCRNMK